MSLSGVALAKLGTDTWIAAGQTISASNLTSSYTAGSASSCTSLPGTWPGGSVYLQLPSFQSAGVSKVQGGTYDATTNTVTVSASTTQIVVTLDG
jgi:hypothetical protein